MTGTAPLHALVTEGVAIVEIDNPPVNALFGAIRDGLATLLPRLDADDMVKAVLIVSAGPTFCAGVDLKKTAGETEPFFFHAALDAMDQFGKPIAAAIQGAALGGGLELALACHYRMAGPKARFGLPEVEVGIIPGACGTQRLPRLIPLDCALGVAALGDILDRAKATALGLIDAEADAGDFRSQAFSWARGLIGRPVRRTRDLPVLAGDDPDHAFACAAARAATERPGETAPLKAIAAVRAAVEYSFDQGVAEEKRLVTDCKYSPQARAMRYLFFAERRAGKADAPATSLTDLRIHGSQAGTLAALASRNGIRAGDAIDIHAVTIGEPAPQGIAIIFPQSRFGVVEIAAPTGTDEGLLAALVQLVKHAGRAVVIGRGVRLGAALATAASLTDEADRLVASGAARSLGELDLIAIASLGFSRASGGPFYQRSLQSGLPGPAHT